MVIHFQLVLVVFFPNIESKAKRTSLAIPEDMLLFLLVGLRLSSYYLIIVTPIAFATYSLTTLLSTPHALNSASVIV